jgi:hypothetical protein
LPDGINAIEIVRDGPKAQSREEVKTLLSSARALISFENSAIVMEAILSGTPAILIKSDFFHEGIAEDEVDMLGIRWGFSEENIRAANLELDKAQALYFASVNKYLVKLAEFVDLVQTQAANTTYTSVIRVPEFSHTVNRHRISLAIGVLRTQGIMCLVKITATFFLRRITRKNWSRK